MSENDRNVSSKVTFFNHPVHPMLVDFPIAFLSLAFLADIGYWRSGDLFWARGSGWLIGLGLLTGVAAAVIGAIDFFTVVPARARRTGWIHFIVNVIVLAVTLLNGLLRFIDLTAYILFFGLILSGICAVLLAVGGWFGGELSFRYGIGVHDDDQ